jgi:hypothetical protein
MYNMKHVKGAIHNNFSNFTQMSLRQLIPGFNTTILIYCNNHIDEGVLKLTAPRAFITEAVIPSMAPPTTTPITLAQNIPTYINLYGYGPQHI